MSIFTVVNDWLKRWTWAKAYRVLLKALKYASKEQLEDVAGKIRDEIAKK